MAFQTDDALLSGFVDDGVATFGRNFDEDEEDETVELPDEDDIQELSPPKAHGKDLSRMVANAQHHKKRVQAETDASSSDDDDDDDTDEPHAPRPSSSSAAAPRGGGKGLAAKRLMSQRVVEEEKKKKSRAAARKKRDAASKNASRKKKATRTPTKTFMAQFLRKYAHFRYFERMAPLVHDIEAQVGANEESGLLPLRVEVDSDEFNDLAAALKHHVDAISALNASQDTVKAVLLESMQPIADTLAYAIIRTDDAFAALRKGANEMDPTPVSALHFLTDKFNRDTKFTRRADAFRANPGDRKAKKKVRKALRAYSAVLVAQGVIKEGDRTRRETYLAEVHNLDVSVVEKHSSQNKRTADDYAEDEGGSRGRTN